MKIFTFVLFVVCLQTINTFGQSAPPSPARVVEEDEEVPFSYVEQMPQFPGGNEMMYKFLEENLQFPDSCRLKSIAGQTIVQFTVDKEGYIVNPKVVRTPQPECGYSEEALRILSLMNEMDPRWSPGMHNGRKVPVRFTLPLKFVFKEE